MGLKISSKRFVLSDQTKNLYGFVVITAGIDLSAFKDNPVMLYNHDYDKLIGQWVDYRIEGTQLTAAPAFDENDPYAMQQYQKVEDGILKGASVGISPVKFDEANSEMSASLLLEASVTPVPNNRSALAIYNAKGQKLSASEIPMYLLSVERTDPPINNNQEMKKELILALVALCAQAGHTIALSAESKDEDFAGAIKKVGEKITSLEQAKTDLSAKVENFEKDAKTAAEKEIDDLLAQGVTDLKLTAADVPAFKELGKVNLSALKTTLSALKPVAIVAIPGAEDKTKDAPGADDKAGWDYDKYALSAPNELAEMETKQPEKFKVLLSAKLDKVRNTYTIPA
ncbi:HK97 family phage prohead protease [Mucilaginibacter sp.]|uniref:HK97 family phage prohead protease n=1 Tax=Mucilaginibacter sp. TaxID=1882438 RepID=UPI000CCB81B7|nr:HK97 family phage prohead protease [Mucilaginibacter sp.]PLW89990.1 MAG: hypothetical protein C0154_08685 [Mucilaginibacter sp.]PMP65784.1 MAG: hypothetical protein C0191_02675 [Mucilaginibacter sp.]